MDVVNYFNNEACNLKFSMWISNFPESFHPSDLDRFTDMVIALLDNNEELEIEYINQSRKKIFEDRMVSSYMDRYRYMRDIYMKLKDRWSTE
jgi:hypothetical protein